MDVLIRKASEVDAAALAHVGARLFEQTYVATVSPEDMAGYLEENFHERIQLDEIRDPDVSSLLVEVGGEVLGFAQLRRAPLEMEDAPRAEVELWRIYVDQRLHGGGVAQRLLKEVGREARSLGATGVWLSTWEKNDRAIAFYKKQGFEPVGHQTFRVCSEIQCDLVLRSPVEAL